MGFAISWIAINGYGKEKILADAKLHDTGEPDEYNETPMSIAELPDNWYLIWLNRFDHPLASKTSLLALSASGRIIAAMVEEHVMYSTACEYQGGKLLWQVSHDAQKGIFDLSAEGALPAGFDGIKADVLAQQQHEGGEKADVDYVFEIPLRVAQEICGFKHDETSPDDGGPQFTSLTAN